MGVFIEYKSYSQDTISVFIKDTESLSDEVSSEFVHFTSNTSDEFVNAEDARLINVEFSEDSSGFIIVEVDLVILEGLGEFSVRDSSVVIIVHNLKLTLKTNEASSASLVESLSDFFYTFLGIAKNDKFQSFSKREEK